MSATDKAEEQRAGAQGQGQANRGQRHGDRHLHAEGVKDEKSGQIKQVGEKVKDVFR